LIIQQVYFFEVGLTRRVKFRAWIGVKRPEHKIIGFTKKMVGREGKKIIQFSPTIYPGMAGQDFFDKGSSGTGHPNNKNGSVGWIAFDRQA